MALAEPGAAEARTTHTTTTAAAGKARAATSHRATKRRTPKPKHKRTRRASPRPDNSKRSAMPVGWNWPPSEAMQDEGRACLADLDRLGVKWQPAPAEYAISTPVIVADGDFAGLIVKRTRSKGETVMDCELARALARDAAPTLRKLQVSELHVGQIHATRSVEGKPGVMSRHTLGLAVDVYALVTRDGQEHLVQTGYWAGDPVLHVAEMLLGKTGAFRTLMTPGNDPGPHYNHFHMEARAFGDKVVVRLTRGASSDWLDVLDVLARSGTTPRVLGWFAPLCPPCAGALLPR